ncbi:D-methionine transport system permease protein [Desulfitobacterium sp. LBE]|uniref:Binding-protein-dependent transport systems inner membrane component n=1 Tax=Desulfitobacterium hafniense (strain DSM 10664 / DCB-2) TaxID=272564 RepID=B8FP13_DESHD|nr:MULTISPECIES: methionine ABC transporter permease [Desulfitobacterium]ACL19538.1 binding-protein-dependent transport systems inner membrane component [Desulfitobacterium hafniense DCB-2]TWH57625.1 D-methionine transport system permease protein [Desulfitobacterium sp. LBE]
MFDFTNPQYWETIYQLLVPATGETLYMVMASTLLAYLLGVPLGVILVISSPDHISPNPWIERTLGTVINIFRSAPFIVLLLALIPVTQAIMGTYIGTDAAIIPLVFATAPFVARMVESSLKEIPYGVIEAALSMGSSPWQIIRKVLLPEAKASLILGAAITTISVVGYTAMAGTIGAGGLGDVAIRYGHQRFRTDVMIMTVIILVIIVQLVQLFGTKLARRISNH